MKRKIPNSQPPACVWNFGFRRWGLVFTLTAALIACRAPARSAAAPDFALPMLDSQTARLSNWKGHPVLLLFYSPNSAESLATLAALDDLWSAYDGVVIAAVSSADRPTIIAATQRLELRRAFLLLDDSSAAATLYGVKSWPTVFVIGRDGCLRFTWAGKQAWFWRAARWVADGGPGGLALGLMAAAAFSWRRSLRRHRSEAKHA